MKPATSRFKWTMCIVFIVFTFGWLSTSSAQTNRQYSMGWEVFAPYQYTNESGKLTGLDIELIRAIMNLAGAPVSFKEVPWKRHLKEVELGQIDLAAGASKTPEREKYAYFSEPYRTESFVLYIRKGDTGKWGFKKLADIVDSPFQLCVTRGYYYGEDYEKLTKNKNFLKRLGEVTHQSQCYQMLSRKYVDGFLSDPFTATAELRKVGMLDDVEMLFTVSSDNIYVTFSKASTSPELVKRFNENLEKLKRSGDYYAILKKYIKLKEEEISEEERPVVAQKTQPSQPESTAEKATPPLPQPQAEELKGMDALAAYQAITLQRYLKEGRSGEDIMKLKIILKKLGYYKGTIDTFFRSDLTQAVREFQLKNNLSPDGIVGPMTYGALGAALRNN